LKVESSTATSTDIVYTLAGTFESVLVMRGEVNPNEGGKLEVYEDGEFSDENKTFTDSGLPAETEYFYSFTPIDLEGYFVVPVLAHITTTQA
jgi:hypothetical protein